MLSVLGCRLTYQGQAETNAWAWFSIALRQRKPEGSLGRTAQDGHLGFHTAPELRWRWRWRRWSLLYSAVLRSRADSLRSHVFLHEWLAFYSAFLNILRCGVGGLGFEGWGGGGGEGGEVNLRISMSWHIKLYIIISKPIYAFSLAFQIFLKFANMHTQTFFLYLFTSKCHQINKD